MHDWQHWSISLGFIHIRGIYSLITNLLQYLDFRFLLTIIVLFQAFLPIITLLHSNKHLIFSDLRHGLLILLIVVLYIAMILFEN